MLAAVWALITAANISSFPAGPYTITDIAWPFSHVFMLVVALAAWRAKVWVGRPVWMLALCGCALPAAMAVRAILGSFAMALPFGVFTTVSLVYTAHTLQR